MKLISVKDPQAFQKRVLSFLLEKQAQNCLGIGIIETLVNCPDVFQEYYLWLIEDNGAIKGVSWWTPPHPIGLSEMPEIAIETLLEEVLHLPQQLSSVIGPKPQADLFRDSYIKKTQRTLLSSMEQRIYQASKATLPFEVQGQMRVATSNDLELVSKWSYAFAKDCGLGLDEERIKSIATRSIQQGNRFLWEINGLASAMAGVSGPTPSGIRISSVYTPDNLRGRGYASAIVCGVTNRMISEGKRFCFLYTDLSNPTSNSIYQRLGYLPVCDSAHHSFKSPAS